MVDIQEKFKVNIEELQTQQISVLRATYREGEKHLKYYYGTMSAFKYPEQRIKCFDTKYYEEVMPEIAKILKAHEQLKQKVK